MYSSLDKIDILSERDGVPFAVQTDHRDAAEIVAEPEISVLFAIVRVRNAAAWLAEQGHANGRVRYALAGSAPELLREAVAATGGLLESMADAAVTDLGTGSSERASALADRAFNELATRVLTRLGTSDLVSALRTLEAETTADPPDREEDERGYFARILELSAVCGELLRTRFGGGWVQNDHALFPFGFKIDRGDRIVMFPTSRAQRVIDEGPDHTLLALLGAVEEAVAGDTVRGRIMPSLRARSLVPLDDIAWRPLLESGDDELPIIAYGNDGETTFAFCTREAGGAIEDLAEQALANLRDEVVKIDPIDVQGFQMVVVSGGFYAAEKILDERFLTTLHQRLSAPLLAVAAPARGLMMATSAAQEPERIATFAALVRMRFDDAASHAVSPSVMIASEGRVVGFAKVGGEPPPAEEPKSGWFRRWFGRS